jgi:adenylyl-sulfate kinase
VSNKVIWLTGLPCSGKTTIAKELDMYNIDGDEIRKTISSDLGFSEEDRAENMRRVATIAMKKLHEDNVVVSTISPLESHRKVAKDILLDQMLLVYISTPLEECEKRDVKGMYKLAREGQFPFFTGIGSPYEPPKDADLIIDTTLKTIVECVELIKEELK